MSEAKHKQLIAEGKLWPDGTHKEVCPTCQRPLAQGEVLPGATVAEAETVEVGAVAPDTGSEG